MPAGRPEAYDPKFCDIVMEVGKRGGSLTEMAVECGISKQSLYNYIETHDEFFDAVTRARDLSQVWWEKIGRQASEGKIQNFSANAFTFQMRNRFVDYRDTTHVETNSRVDLTGLPAPQIGGIQFTVIDPAKLATEDLESLANILQSQNKSQLTIEHEVNEND